MIELYASDIHFPFEDRAVWGLFLQVVQKVKPDLIFLGGDILDCYTVSKYDKDPNRKMTTQADLDYSIEELKALRQAAPRSCIVFLEGNHETRLKRFLESRSPELSTLNALELKNLLNLNQLDIRWIENGTKVPVGKLWHLHGNEVSGGGANVARSKFSKLGVNIIFGHHHTQQNYIKRDYEGSVRGAWANGCMCLLQPDYAHFTDWIQGFTLIEYAKSGNFNVEQVVVTKPDVDSLKAACVVRGKEFSYDASKMPKNPFEDLSSRKIESKTDLFSQELF